MCVKMASDFREASLCDKSKQSTLLQSFYQQKHSHQFCDVLMKVCNKEIYAHSNILAATSPYFDSFLRQDLPRQFSQRSPQIIVIQVDGNEPNELYEDAVTIVIDFLYTGIMTISSGNVSQVYEISKIMQIREIVSFCEDFLQGRVEHGTLYTIPCNLKVHCTAVNTDITAIKESPESSNTWTKLSKDRGLASPSFIQFNKNKSRKLVSVSVQTTSIISQVSEPTATNTPIHESSRGNNVKHFKRKRPLEPDDNTSDKKSQEYNNTKPCHDTAQENIKKMKVQGNVRENEPPKVITRSGRVVIPKNWDTTKRKRESRPEVQGKDQSSVADDTEVISCVTDSRHSSSEKHIETENAPIGGDENVFNDEISEDDVEDVLCTSHGNIDSDDTLDSDQNKESNIDDKSRNEESATVSPKFGSREDLTNHSLVEEAGQEKSGQKSVAVTMVGADDVGSHSSKGGEIDIILPLSNLERCSDTVSEGLENSDEDEDYQPDADQDNDIENEPNNELVVIKKRGRPKKSILTADMIKQEPGTEKIGKEYACSECNFVTSRVREMSAHTMYHMREQGLCFYCDKTFPDKRELLQHSATHKGLTPFECLKCGIRFKTRTMLNLHLPKHSNVKPFQCELCSMAFKWKHALKNHMVVHSNKREHLCDICGYSTAHKAQLRSHSLIHTGDTFKCDYPGCNFETTKKQNLHFHGVTHTRERAHQCEICGQNFSLLKNMKRHIKLHYTHRQHRCESCGFTSARFDKLKEHLLKHHGTGTPPERRVKVADMPSRREITLQATPGVTEAAPDSGFSQTLVMSPGQGGEDDTGGKERGEAFTLLTQLLEGGQAGAQTRQHGQLQYMAHEAGLSSHKEADVSVAEVSMATHMVLDAGQLTSVSTQEVATDQVTTVDLEQLRALEEVNSILAAEAAGSQVILNAPSITLQELANALRQNEESAKLVPVSMESPHVTSASFSLDEGTQQSVASQVPLHIVKEEGSGAVQYLEVLVDTAAGVQ